MSSVPQPSLPFIAPTPAVPATPAPAYRLFDANAVTLATFFGTPVAGATLMFINDRRMARTTGSSLILLAAMAVTGLTVFLAWNIPPAASSIFALVLLLGMRSVATLFQGKYLADHVSRGGQVSSRWSAFGIGVLYLAIIFLIAFAVVAMQTKSQQGTRMVIGSKDEIFYRGAATQADALALGNALKADKYFTDKGVSVALDKSANGSTVSFVVKEGGWNQPDMVAAFDEIGREIAPSIGGFPLNVRMMDKNFEVKLDSTVGKVTLGNDSVYYFGSATDAQAKALAAKLQSLGFFTGKGADVFLSKQSDGTTLSFVVGDGVWTNPETVASFEKIARDAAPAIGGLPFHLHLEDTTLDIKKDIPLF